MGPSSKTRGAEVEGCADDAAVPGARQWALAAAAADDAVVTGVVTLVPGYTRVHGRRAKGGFPGEVSPVVAAQRARQLLPERRLMVGPHPHTPAVHVATAAPPTARAGEASGGIACEQCVSPMRAAAGRRTSAPRRPRGRRRGTHSRWGSSRPARSCGAPPPPARAPARRASRRPQRGAPCSAPGVPAAAKATSMEPCWMQGTGIPPGAAPGLRKRTSAHLKTSSSSRSMRLSCHTIGLLSGTRKTRTRTNNMWTHSSDGGPRALDG